MTLRILLSFLLFLGSYFSWSQQLSIYKTFGGYRFEKDSIAISPKMIMRLMEPNVEAYNEFKKANANYNIMSVMKFTGGALILFPAATAIAGGEPEWGLAAGGLALLLGSIPLNSSFQQHALNALDIYNGKLSGSRKSILRLTLTSNGGSLQFKF